MSHPDDEFSAFEHRGWQRVADGFDASWGALTRLFIEPLLAAVDLGEGDRLLDVACGPGYGAAAAGAIGAHPAGVDFSAEMIRIARGFHPEIEFHEGDAQALAFVDRSFDVVVMNFGVLHFAAPEQAFAEACRVLRPGGRYGFTVWAGPEQSPGARMVDEVIVRYADQSVSLPQGPDVYAYGKPDECRATLARAGFDPATFEFATVTRELRLPDADRLFELERDHGVRVAALLAAQTPETLETIRKELAVGAERFASDLGFSIPFAAHIARAAR